MNAVKSFVVGLGALGLSLITNEAEAALGWFLATDGQAVYGSDAACFSNGWGVVTNNCSTSKLWTIAVGYHLGTSSATYNFYAVGNGASDVSTTCAAIRLNTFGAFLAATPQVALSSGSLTTLGSLTLEGRGTLQPTTAYTNTAVIECWIAPGGEVHTAGAA